MNTENQNWKLEIGNRKLEIRLENLNWKLIIENKKLRLELKLKIENRNKIYELIFLFQNIPLLSVHMKYLVKGFLVIFGYNRPNFGPGPVPKYVSEHPNIDQYLLFWIYSCILFFKTFFGGRWVVGKYDFNPT